ncbi:hypothetical protein KOR34_03530 [Posidoniimonas corsicana]|uniref:SLA1 homology domain-containing protein n=1 Tax=Posidoniimonas corsicana TaxID=1938618 RepID=A0A5C5VAY4_9BACT|nr:hypothetical protein [Posidoniimonas corsicana]TWT35461.1 hypothetical protein KOR34_03530 [Posidoniimonas corsicana]
MLYRSLAAALALIASVLQADEPLVWKFSAGEDLAFEVRQTSDVTLDSRGGEVRSKSDQTATLDWKVETVDAAGAAKVVQDIRRLQLTFDAPGGQGYQLDTDSEEPPQGLATMIAPVYRALTEHNCQLTVSPQGEILKSEPPEEVLQSLKNFPGAAALGKGGALYQQLLRPALIEVPAGELKVGQKWVSFIEAPLAMFGVEAAEFQYEYLGEREADGRPVAAIGVRLMLIPPEDENAAPVQVRVVQSEGEVLFDREAGRVHSARLESRCELKFTDGKQVTTGEVTQTATAKLAPAGE